MNSLKIQKDISTFEQQLSEAQWGNGCLLFFLPFGLMFIFIPVILMGFLLKKILGINIFNLIPPVELSLALTFIGLVYYGGKEVHKIQKDLNTKSYLPVITSIHKLYINISETESGTEYSYFAQLIEIDFVIGKAVKKNKKKVKITIEILKETYVQLKKGEHLFILVGKHSNKWYCTDERFKEEGLGFSFFH